MKKILNIVLVITSMSFAGCTQYPEKPAELKNVRTDTSVGFLQIAPVGSAQITHYSVKGVITEKTTDTAYVSVNTINSDTKVVIAVSSKAVEMKKGDGVTLTAEQWSGGYEGGWYYTIKK